MMTNRLFLRLSDRWALAHNSANWTVMQWRPQKWRAVSYVSSSKAVLMRVLDEEGAVITPDAKAAIDNMPMTFKQWIRQRDCQERRTAK